MKPEDARALAREMYEQGWSLLHDLAEFVDVALYAEGDQSAGNVSELVRAFLAAWVIEDVQPVGRSPHKVARHQALRKVSRA